MFSLENLTLLIEGNPFSFKSELAVIRLKKTDLGKPVHLGVEYEIDEPPLGEASLRIEIPRTSGDYAVSETPSRPVEAQGLLELTVEPEAFGQIAIYVLHNGETVAGYGLRVTETPD